MRVMKLYVHQLELLRRQLPKPTRRGDVREFAVAREESHHRLAVGSAFEEISFDVVRAEVLQFKTPSGALELRWVWQGLVIF